MADAPRPLRPRQAIEQMAPYTPPTSSRQGKLRLDFNENTIGCSPQVLRVLKKQLSREGLSIYPEYTEARAQMAPFLGVDAEQILLTNGTDEAIHAVISTYVNPGDEVLIPWPTFPMFRFYPEVAGAAPRTVAYRQPDLAFPVDELCDAVTERTKAILIANPNNPTGTAIPLADVEKILRRAGEAAVMIDEAYFEFYGVTARDLIPAYPNLFVSRTFSKVYGLAALRVGYLMSREENIRIMRKGQSPYSVNSVALTCALAALEDEEYMRSYVSEVLESREMLYRGLKRLRVPYYRSEANFVLAHFGACVKQVCAGLREKGILIRDRSHELAGTARITAGKKAQTRKVLAALKEVLAACER